jgi:hypothetical protein
VLINVGLDELQFLLLPAGQQMPVGIVVPSKSLHHLCVDLLDILVRGLVALDHCATWALAISQTHCDCHPHTKQGPSSHMNQWTRQIMSVAQWGNHTMCWCIKIMLIISGTGMVQFGNVARRGSFILRAVLQTESPRERDPLICQGSCLV